MKVEGFHDPPMGFDKIDGIGRFHVLQGAYPEKTVLSPWQYSLDLFILKI